MSDFLRLFVAYDLSAPLRDAFSAGQRHLAGQVDRWRPIPLPNAHCTLRFLGDVPRDVLPELQSTIAALPLPPKGRCQAGVSKWGAFRRPKGHLVWMGLSPSPEAYALNEALQRHLDALNLLPPERRPWQPHVTAARDVRFSKAPTQVLDALPLLDTAHPLSRLTLYESRFTPQGMQYLPLLARAL